MEPEDKVMRTNRFMMAALALAIAFAFATSAWADEYALDPAHSQIGFAVKHMVITKVRGVFETYDGSFELDKNNTLVSAKADIEVKSINTRIEKRDNHLRSEDFFYAEQHPRMSFVSKTATKLPDGTYAVTGLLTIRGVSKDVTLTGEITGPVKDPWGYQRVGFHATTTVNRKDFGLLWNQTLETGGVLVGDDVEITVEGEGILKK